MVPAGTVITPSSAGAKEKSPGPGPGALSEEGRMGQLTLMLPFMIWIGADSGTSVAGTGSIWIPK